MVHLYHIFSGWVSVLISCIQAAKPYVDSEPFSWWFTQQRLPMAAETMALLIARQVLGQYSPNRARSSDAPVYAAPEHARRRGLLAACLGGLWDVVHFRDCVWVNLLPDAVPVESS